MVGMFVSEKQRGDILRLAPDMRQALFQHARTETDIDQDTGFAAFDVDGVALTAAGEYGKLKNGSSPSSFTNCPVYEIFSNRQ